jgi:uncharacterized protein YdhG (YjbR/CyaY superfamily)
MMDKKVQAFMKAIPKDSKPLFNKLQALVLGMYPEAEVAISYGIPMYRARGGWVGLGYWKEGVSLYTNNPKFIAGLKKKYPAIKTNKASINLRLTDPFPAAELKKVIRAAMEQKSKRK